MLQTTTYIKKTIIHHPTPEPTILLERVVETKDLNTGHVHAQVTPLPEGYGPADDAEKAALVKLEPMPSGHRVSVGHGKRETQEEYDARMAPQAPEKSPSMLEASGLVAKKT